MSLSVAGDAGVSAISQLASSRLSASALESSDICLWRRCSSERSASISIASPIFTKARCVAWLASVNAIATSGFVSRCLSARASNRRYRLRRVEGSVREARPAMCDRQALARRHAASSDIGRQGIASLGLVVADDVCGHSILPSLLKSSSGQLSKRSRVSCIGGFMHRHGCSSTFLGLEGDRLRIREHDPGEFGAGVEQPVLNLD
jgi:hypothetical protein